jgi:hypothetical protein
MGIGVHGSRRFDWSGPYCGDSGMMQTVFNIVVGLILAFIILRWIVRFNEIPPQSSMGLHCRLNRGDDCGLHPHFFPMNETKLTFARICLAAAIGSFLGVVSSAQSPRSELQAAFLDAGKLAKEQCQGTHYITLYDAPPELREKTAATIGGMLNILSRVGVISPISKDNYVSDTLIRFNFTSYAVHNSKEYLEWHKAWEDMATFDSAFQIRTEILDHGKRKITAVSGGWCGLEEMQKLKAITGSSAPIITSGFFCTAASHPPYYYLFAGVPSTQGEFLKSIGVDHAVLAKMRVPIGANLFISRVTKKPRQIQWLQGPLGGVYFTLDVDRVTADRNPLRRPLNAFGTDFVYDASEWFFKRRNNLWGVALYDRDGKQQQSVPDRIAKDDSDNLGPGIVYSIASCIRCHQESGLRPFTDDQQQLLSGHGKAVAYDSNSLMLLQEFYNDPKFQEQMNFDRTTYEAAIKKASGLDGKEFSKAFADVIRAHQYLPVNLERAARRCGVSVDEFKFATNNTRDPVIIMLNAGGSVVMEDWSSSEAEAQLSCATNIRRDDK